MDYSGAISERRLLAAILCRAILDYCTTLTLGDLRGARAWIFSQDDGYSSDEFTFPWICEHLDLDSKLIRRQIRRLKGMQEKLKNTQQMVNLITRVVNDHVPPEFQIPNCPE